MIVLALLAGCTPHDAEVNGSYLAYLADQSSDNVLNYERSGRSIADATGKLDLTPVDCRDLNYLVEDADTQEEADAILAAERLPGVDYAADCCAEGSDTDTAAFGTQCTAKEPLWYTWLTEYSFWKTEADVNAWRTEALITSEGDLQLTVHTDIGPFGDFRFGWVIDPDFAPQTCEDGESGAEMVPTDGDWLAAWSENEEGTLWYLNAGAYQTNPNNLGENWYLPQEWRAGYGFGRYGDDQLYTHPTDYVDAYGYPLYYYAYPEDDSGTFEWKQGYDRFVESVDGTMNATDTSEGARVVTDLSDIGKSDFALSYKIEDNNFRYDDETDISGPDGTPDGTVDEYDDHDQQSGFEDWTGVTTSWVRIDNPGDIAVNNATPVTGEFQLYLQGDSAATKVFVKGTFSLDHIREDVWGYSPTLEERTTEENETPTCGDEPSAETPAE